MSLFPDDTDYGDVPPDRVILHGARSLIAKIERMQDAGGEFWDHLFRVRDFARKLGANGVLHALRAYDPADKEEWTDHMAETDMNVERAGYEFLRSIESRIKKSSW